ncbi:MAG: MarR family winged helix-turn-helix transcriptional regulator [Parvularculaceae bacterium]
MPERRRKARANGDQAVSATPQGLEARDMEGLAGYRLRRVGALVVKELGAIFNKIGLAPGQFSVLTLIAQNPGRTQTRLAEMARIDRSTLVPVIDRLEALGFVNRKPSERDRRAYALFVTPKARKAAAQVLPELEAFEDGISVAMTRKEKAGLLSALQKIETTLIEQ